LLPRGRCLGGLGNSWGLFNALMHFSIENNLTVLVPPSCHRFSRMFHMDGNYTSKDYSIKTSFPSLTCNPDLFSTVSEVCGSTSPPKWGVFNGGYPSPHSNLWCNSLAFTTEGEGDEFQALHSRGGRCVPEHLTVAKNSQPSPTIVAECTAIYVVDLSHILWHFNASKTFQVFRQMYYRAFTETYQSPKLFSFMPKKNEPHILVAVHLRLGGGSRFSWAQKSNNFTSLRESQVPAFKEKYMSPLFVLVALEAIFAVIKSACLDIHFFTDLGKCSTISMLTQNGIFLSTFNNYAIHFATLRAQTCTREKKCPMDASLLAFDQSDESEYE
jgi:hypothetical protein